MEAWRARESGPLIIAVGELLLVVCALSYLAWWLITFRPSARTSPGGGLFLSGAVLGGLAGLVVLAVGIAVLLPKASLPALGATIIGCVVVGALLFYGTAGIAGRPVTTELPLIIVWVSAQLAAGITLRTAGVLSAPAASGWIVTTAVATVAGLVCYLLFYRLDPIPAYWVGMVPLAVDAAAAATLAVIATLSRSGA